jgi:arginyl-tRNA synthetase
VLGLGPAVAGAARGAEPHVLAAFLFGVASIFTTFYEQCPVLAAPSPESRASRLALSALTLRVLITGLGLLGIPVPGRM